MNLTLRRWVYSSFGLLWVTGLAWLVLHFFFQTTSEFGTTAHPLQPPLLIVHGVAAVVAVFLFGWVAGTHVGERLPRQANRPSGLSLLVAVALLGVSGFANYYLTADSVRAAVQVLHEILGVLAVVPMVQHWPLGERKRS